MCELLDFYREIKYEVGRNCTLSIDWKIHYQQPEFDIKRLYSEVFKWYGLN